VTVSSDVHVRRTSATVEPDRFAGREFSVSVEPGSPGRLTRRSTAGWSVRDVAAGDAYVAAVAVEASGIRILPQVWQDGRVRLTRAMIGQAR
jgi:hypothetical protein